MDRELLLEIGCEEIPASWLPGLTNQVGDVVLAQPEVWKHGIDGFSGATALGQAKLAGLTGMQHMTATGLQPLTWWDAFIGFEAGSVGTDSAMMLLSFDWNSSLRWASFQLSCCKAWIQ